MQKVKSIWESRKATKTGWVGFNRVHSGSREIVLCSVAVGVVENPGRKGVGRGGGRGWERGVERGRREGRGKKDGRR